MLEGYAMPQANRKSSKQDGYLVGAAIRRWRIGRSQLAIFSPDWIVHNSRPECSFYGSATPKIVSSMECRGLQIISTRNFVLFHHENLITVIPRIKTQNQSHIKGIFIIIKWTTPQNYIFFRLYLLISFFFSKNYYFKGVTNKAFEALFLGLSVFLRKETDSGRSRDKASFLQMSR